MSINIIDYDLIGERVLSIQKLIDDVLRISDYDMCYCRINEIKSILSINCYKIYNDINMNALLIEKSKLKKMLSRIDLIRSEFNELLECYNITERDDHDFLYELDSNFRVLMIKVIDLKFKSYFIDSKDNCNAFLDLQAGSGGVDAQDWVSILLNMYSSWSNNNKMRFDILSLCAEDIGIKHVSVKVTGKYALGFLKNESGIHRLVRRSPFNTNSKRHTSFASVCVYPDNDIDINLIIHDRDLCVNTFRSSGAGGQHVNKTDSAVRMKHLPTGVIVQCQAYRSQHKNRSQALKQLKAKLYKLEYEKKKIEKQKSKNIKHSISWGNHIRSYVLDQSRVKDIRVNLEISNVNMVLNGYLDPFIFALLENDRKRKQV